MIGETLGHYMVLDLLGAGGMGEVYLAEDLTLHRQIALKVLREPLAGSQRQLERFRREAETLASIDHPNIVTLFTVEEVDGVHFLTMQLINGAPLSTKIPDEGLPLKEVLQIGIGLAEALAAAHQKGVIHRDLKPGNIMVTPDGQPKILDFGLAKLREEALGSVSAEATTEDMTEEGRLIGTITYMSPEQARGEPVGTRSDIFALGNILYEMCTGQRPFTGATKVAVLSDILLSRPRPVSRIRSDLPRRLGKIVQTALSKSPEARQESAGILRDQLRTLQNEIAVSESHSSSAFTQLLSGSSWITLRRNQLVIGLVAILVLSVTAAWYLIVGRQSVFENVRVTFQEALATGPEREEGGSVSPSGQMWAYVSYRSGEPEIWLGSADSEEARPIRSGATGYKNIVWSPDERQIAFLQESDDRVTLEIASLWGAEASTPRPIEEPLYDVGLICWIGSRLYLYRVDPDQGRVGILWRYDLEAQTEEQVTDDDSGKRFLFQGDIVSVDVSHDEKRIVFASLEDDRGDLWVSNLNGRNARRLTDHPSRVASPRWWGRDGDLILYITNESGQFDIWVTDSRDSVRRSLTSSPLEELALSVSADGAIVIADTALERSHLWTTSLDGAGAPLLLTNDSRNDIWPGPGPARSDLIFHRSRSALKSGFSPFETEILAATMNGTDLSDPAVLVDDGFAGKLSPDGKRIAFLRYRLDEGAARAELWAQSVERGASPVLISDRFVMSSFEIATWAWLWNNFEWAPTGTTLYFFERNSERIDCLVRVDLGEDRASDPEALDCATDSSRGLADIRVSPDGNHLAYLHKSDRRGDGGEVRVLASGDSRTFRVVQTLGPGATAFLKGWTRERALIVLASMTGEDGDQASTVYSVVPGGDPTVLGPIEHLRGANSHLEPAVDALLVIREVDHAWAVSSYSLGTGELHQVIRNRVPGLTFVGTAVLSSEKLVYAVKEDIKDVWRLELSHE